MNDNLWVRFYPRVSACAVIVICAAVLLGLLMGCATIQAPATKPQAAPPPAKYDHVYDGNEEVFYETAAAVKERCAPFSNAVVHGCSYTFKGEKTCHVYVSTESRYDQASILRHETGHCNGWPGNHPMFAKRGAKPGTPILLNILKD